MFWVIFWVLALCFLICLIGFILFLLTISKKTKFDQDSNKKIIIPFRNEEENLGRLLLSIENLSEVNKDRFLFVDDHSDDNSLKILSQSGMNYISLSDDECGKKAALIKGVKVVDTDEVLFNDADVVYNSGYETIIRKSPQEFDLAILPIWPDNEEGVLNKLIQLDYAQIVFATFSFKGNLGSGANLIINRKTYLELNGSIHTEILSGDDYFIIKEAKRRNKNIIYVSDPEARVLTIAPRRINELIGQRGRWIKKSLQKGGLAEVFSAIGLMAYSCLTYILIIQILRTQEADWVLLIMFKMAIDTVVFAPGLILNRALRLLYLLPLLEILYPIYYLAVLLKAFSKNKWKGRDI